MTFRRRRQLVSSSSSGDIRSYAALTPAEKARLAYMRFGLGPKLNGKDAIGNRTHSAREALRAELDRADRALIPDDRVIARNVRLTMENCTRFAHPQLRIGNDWIRPLPIEILAAERAARFTKHLEPDIGFVERLVMFWSNHFNVFRGKHGFVQGTAGHMERSVIRRHVLGKFSDMLKGVVQHPAMIFYLDNHQSTGPTSEIGKGSQIHKLNENLGREILELHTVGVSANYTQTDVENLAKLITGWTIVDINSGLSTRGQFRYDVDRSEPGRFTVMRGSFLGGSQQQGLAALDMLANQVETARHIAFKLLRHFVADEPSPAMVRSLTETFQSTRGDLKKVAEALIDMDAAWSMPMTRLRLPYPWFVSMMRVMQPTAAQVTAQEDRAKGILESLGHHVWGHQTPEGYTDLDSYWKNSDAVRRRRNVARQYVETMISPAVGYKVPPRVNIVDNLMGSALSRESTDAVRGMSSDRDALTLLFVTPEFLRR